MPVSVLPTEFLCLCKMKSLFKAYSFICDLLLCFLNQWVSDKSKKNVKPNVASEYIKPNTRRSVSPFVSLSR